MYILFCINQIIVLGKSSNLTRKFRFIMLLQYILDNYERYKIFFQFLGSSAAEQLAVNQLVVGSIPTRGAKYHNWHFQASNQTDNARNSLGFCLLIRVSKTQNL